MILQSFGCLNLLTLTKLLFLFFLFFCYAIFAIFIVLNEIFSFTTNGFACLDTKKQLDEDNFFVA